MWLNLLTATLLWIYCTYYLLNLLTLLF